MCPGLHFLNRLNLLSDCHMLVENWNHCAAEPVDWLLVLVTGDQSDWLPSIADHIVDRCSHNALTTDSFESTICDLVLYGVVPEHSNVLSVNLEQGVVNEVPRGWFPARSLHQVSFRMPSWRFQVKTIDKLSCWHLRGIQQIDLFCSTNHKHIKLVHGYGSVALTTGGACLQSVLNLSHLVGLGVKNFHSF